MREAITETITGSTETVHTGSLFGHADKTIQKRQTLHFRFKQCAQLIAPYL